MSTHPGAESEWEDLALEKLADLGWVPTSGDQIAPGREERGSWDDLPLPGRLMEALRTLNPGIPNDQLLQARAEILSPQSNDAITENLRVHEWLTRGYRITYIDELGTEQSPTLRVLSTEPSENDWLAVNQVTIKRPEGTRRFDVVLYCNGLPVAIIELKKAGALHADLAAAHAQLATYLREFPTAFRFCVLTVVSDGILARYGTPFTPLNHYSPWNVDDDGRVLPHEALGEDGQPLTALEATLDGVFNLDRFGQLTRGYVAFDEGEGGLAKRIAKPHQYFAVSKAVASTIEAVRTDGRAGVVWHTQGSGKSMEMELYTNQVQRHPLLANPTVVVITDRKELDGQLYGAFFISRLLPETPRQIRTRSELREQLSGRQSGGILFTTLQKFGRTTDERFSGSDHPLLSNRRNIVVVVDEAHRSHYDDLDGYAKHLRDALPHATLIAFTGTPISTGERDTQRVFGDYIDVYDLSRAVADGATVPVYFESRLVKVGLADGVSQDDLDAAADEVTEGLDDAERARLEKGVAVINAVYGVPARLATLADDLLTHWDRRSAAMLGEIEAPGKAMIVCSTREIAARLYEAIIERRPEWHSDAVDSGVIKVVYSGNASDTGAIGKHVRRGSENDVIKNRLRNVDDPLQLVVVKDMMLTGYDSPPLHTLYLDRPLKGALLMQTLARVNRTFRGKEAGLLVGYAPLADNLRDALAEYSATDQAEKPMGKEIGEAAELAKVLLTQLDETTADYDWRGKLLAGWKHVKVTTGLANHLRASRPPASSADTEEIVESTADRFRRLSAQLVRAWALASGADTLAEAYPVVRFYEEVRVYMAKFDAEERRASGRPVPEEIQRLLGAVIAQNTVSGEVVDIYEAAGMPRPQLSDLTPEFLERAQRSTNSHLAIEALRNTVLQESARVTRNNLVRERAFGERVAELMNRYANAQLTAAEVIAELVALAKDVATEAQRGKSFDPPLGTDELAVFDAIADNESAVDVMGTDVLAQIARELVATMQRDVKTDWTIRDDVRAKLRSSIKRLLVKYRYPPDQQAGAVKLVLEQMERLAPGHLGEEARNVE